MSASRAVVAQADRRVGSGVLILVPGQNLRTGVVDFEKVFPDCTSLERDLLTVASAVYACDLAFKRGEREEITRDIELTVPVVNHQAFARLKDKIELLLWTLSHDNWSITFVRDGGQPEAKEDWPSSAGVTVLFSGGVDSFVGAVELLQSRGVDGVQLVSHVTGNPVTHRSQDELAEHLAARFGDGLKKVTVRTGGRNKSEFKFPSDADREETQRTRTFMFLAIAALAARRTGHKELVVIAENGQMAIHLPLSPARIGAFSTHTAHPEFVALSVQFFSDVLDVDYTITNPYLYATKGEVVAKLGTADRGVLAKSVSCWRGARVPSYDHCGECTPCLVRRVAFEVNGIRLSEYKRDLLAEADILALSEEDEGKRNLVEFAEFAYTFRTQSEGVLIDLFPDLINPEFNCTNAISMYRRFANEAETVLRSYPGPAALLPPVMPTPSQARGGKGKNK
jgi:7-cyano-7-deazaguanine synthase in queuosine biosynthesis